MNESPPLEEQPAPPLTEEQMLALAAEATAALRDAQGRYALAKARSMTDAQGKLLVAPFQLQLEIDLQRVRMDALLFVLSQMGINVVLPLAQLMPQLFDRLTEQLGAVQIASGVHRGINSKKREN